MKLSIEALSEGFYLAGVVRGLYRIGVIQSLQIPSSSLELSERYLIDETLLETSLYYLAERSDILIHDGENYHLVVKIERLQYFINQYLEAFAPALLKLDKLIADPTIAASFINRDAHSDAFTDQTNISISELPRLIKQFQCQSLLELGCGTGAMLIELAEADDDFIGIGIDNNPAMCEQAIFKIKERGLEDRIFIHCENATQLNRNITLNINFDGIQAVSMTSLMNELFYPNTDKAVTFLAHLRHLLPGKIAFIGDYYGRLGSSQKACSHALLHDYVQQLSGQGIPPGDVDKWQIIYEQAGCQLIHAYESESLKHIPYFIHLLKL